MLNLKDVKSIIFSGGELHVQLTEYQLKERDLDVGILKSANDLMKLILTIDAIKQQTDDRLTIRCPYLPYARQDRVCSRGQAFSLDIVCRMLDYSEVCYIFTDIHNPKAVHFDYADYQNDLPLFVDKETLLSYDLVIAPDKGAIERAEYQAQGILPVIQAEKVRDVNTGWITDYNIDVSKYTGKKALVIDDLCDGGKTFELLGNKLKEESIFADLYVTHGLFSKGKSELLKYYNSVSAAYDWTTD